MVRNRRPWLAGHDHPKAGIVDRSQFMGSRPNLHPHGFQNAVLSADSPSGPAFPAAAVAHFPGIPSITLKREVGFMVDWSDDRIAALSDQDLKNLLVNAERKAAAAVVAQCKAEMEKRDAAKPRKTAKPRTELKEFEHDMSGQLAAVGKEMAEKYDLSEETAKARSVGVKGFKAHRLLDAKGYAKLGGMQRDGSVALDRSIQY